MFACAVLWVSAVAPAPRFAVSLRAQSPQSAPPPAQTPKPTPTPFPGVPPASSTPKPAPQGTPPQAPVSQAACPAVDAATIDPALAGIPIYPCAVYLQGFSSGYGQKLFVFGTNDAYASIVTFYKTQMKKSGEEVSKAPAIYQFERGTPESDPMAPRPGIVVKDYAWPSATDAYLHVSGTEGTRYRSIIQIILGSK